ncbi:MAG: ABC transporter permease [Chloroflexi bacterium]|nr:ABC transporter permease [Chloroflexota bacterium]
MNYLRGIYVIWLIELLRLWHDKARLFGSLAMPLLLLLIFGAGLKNSMGNLAPGVDFVKFIFPGVIGMTVLTSSLMSGVSLVWDREFGFLKEVLVAPVPRSAVAVGKTVGAATIAVGQALIIMLIGPLIGATFSVTIILKLIPIMLLLSVSLSSMGILLATRIKSMEGFQVIMQMLMMPMIFLSGVFFPMNNLPAWMNFLVKINPASYGIAPFREVVLGSGTNQALGIKLFGHTMTLWNNIAVVAVFGIVMIILAMWSFSYQE